MDIARRVLIRIKEPEPDKKTHSTKQPAPEKNGHAKHKARAHLHTHIHEIKLGSSDEVVLGKLEDASGSTQAPHTESIPPSWISAMPKKPITINGITINAVEIAYFCMEIGVTTGIPTYSGGLGILAGDTLKSCADLDVPIVGITLRYKYGYFRQRLDGSGWQFEEDIDWDPGEYGLIRLKETVVIRLEGKNVVIGAWMGITHGVRGRKNPVIFLDTDLPENDSDHRAITDRLYAGDHRHRILQEAVLGIGGLRMIEKIGITNVRKYHMNEGHSALLTVELYRQLASTDLPIEEVRRRAVFTTHTPIASGHDQFSRGEIEGALGGDFVPKEIDHLVFEHDLLSMTRLGLNMSGYRNGVARRHGEVSRELFPGYEIDAITNGVYARGWATDPIAELFDRHLGNWRLDNANLRYALAIPLDELRSAHDKAKADLATYVRKETGVSLDHDAFTIGFARRMTGYKRPALLLSDIDRLVAIAERSGRGIQIVYAGKAHPHDHDGKLIIQEIIRRSRDLLGKQKITCVYLPDYTMHIARTVIGGVDLWLNTPNRPQEASGTSGMKAAINGVPHFSVLDGWWLEGHIEGVTGWSIGPHPEKRSSANPWDEDREDLYAKLEYVILPLYENERDQWTRIMRQTIALNGSFFTTQRMVEQYVLSAYFK